MLCVCVVVFCHCCSSLCACYFVLFLVFCFCCDRTSPTHACTSYTCGRTFHSRQEIADARTHRTLTSVHRLLPHVPCMCSSAHSTHERTSLNHERTSYVSCLWFLLCVARLLFCCVAVCFVVCLFVLLRVCCSSLCASLFVCFFLF